jgi:hypothetical protein
MVPLEFRWLVADRGYLLVRCLQERLLVPQGRPEFVGGATLSRAESYARHLRRLDKAGEEEAKEARGRVREAQRLGWVASQRGASGLFAWEMEEEEEEEEEGKERDKESVRG